MSEHGRRVRKNTQIFGQQRKEGPEPGGRILSFKRRTRRPRAVWGAVSTQTGDEAPGSDREPFREKVVGVSDDPEGSCWTGVSFRLCFVLIFYFLATWHFKPVFTFRHFYFSSFRSLGGRRLLLQTLRTRPPRNRVQAPGPGLAEQS